MSAGRCPECEAPLRRPRYCHACGWDGDVAADEAYLDGVDLPDEVGYDEVLEREGLGGGRTPAPRVREARADPARLRAGVILLLALGALLVLALMGRSGG